MSAIRDELARLLFDKDCEALIAEHSVSIDNLERDAARYRWLRETIFLAAVDGYENSYRREKLDAFIDNAMAKDGVQPAPAEESKTVQGE